MPSFNLSWAPFLTYMLPAAAMAAVSHRRVGVRLMVSLSRQTHEAATVGSLLHYFDLRALSLIAHNDGSRFDDGPVQTSGTLTKSRSRNARDTENVCSSGSESDGRMVDARTFRIALLSQINSSLVARNRFASIGNLADAPVPAKNRENREGTHDKCWASFAICRRIVLSLVCCDRLVLFC